jgi:cysteine desulfurase
MKPIYLDFNASTPIAPEVVEAMRPLLTEAFGNPSSLHWAGAPGKAALEAARAQVAALIGAQPGEIVFTGGGSEASNLAIKGAFLAARHAGRNHIVTTSVEHPATLQPCRFLEGLGAEVTRVKVDTTGLVDPDDIGRAMTDRTCLVSVMHANNEVGTIEPIAVIADIAHMGGALMHTDAAQSLGKIEVNVDTLKVDLLTIAGHKLYAPKGVGALYVRQGVRLEPLIHGAGHESGRRAGTESALMAAGLGAACALTARLGPMRDIERLRDRLWEGLRRAFGAGVVLNGHPKLRLPNTLNVSFVGREGGTILGGLDGVAASTGSACHAGRVELSPVLAAMGVSEHVGMGAIRFSLGRTTTEAEIDAVIEGLTAIVPQQRRAG